MNNKKIFGIFTLVCVCILLLLQLVARQSAKQGVTENQPKDTLVAHKVIPIHSWTIAAGTKVIFIPSTRSSAIDIELSFDAGSSRDLHNKSGLAAITAFSLIEGTTSNLDLLKLQEKIHNVGAEYKVTLERDRTKIMLSIANNNIYAMNGINLLSDIISYPEFSEQGTKNAREKLSIYNNKNTKVASILLEQEFYAAMYSNHTYKNPEYGNNEELINISVEDIRQFYNQYYVSGNLVITMIGNINRNKARQFSEIIVANLSKGQRAKDIQDVDGLVTKVEKNLLFATGETQILIGYPMVKMTDTNWASVLVGNYILGNNNLDSILHRELNRKHQISYSATSSIIPLAADGPFKIKTYTEHTKSAEAKMVVLHILQDFVQNGPKLEAVETAKKHLVGAFPLKFSSDKEILQEVSKLAFYNVPLDFFDNFVRKVKQVTRNDIMLAFQAKINLNGLTIVSIGNAAEQS